ncbi:Hypothetical_protein [Hexamita inflata]|uniref:Hypothetical_protein n=1 Tax=Hexamita inflata TaxID=28002 RepID=A0AA86UEC8_9EUKA|nr:Hypothetical protein HINF_LOCUS40034 [Hexamita inflata]
MSRFFVNVKIVIDRNCSVECSSGHSGKRHCLLRYCLEKEIRSARFTAYNISMEDNIADEQQKQLSFSYYPVYTPAHYKAVAVYTRDSILLAVLSCTTLKNIKNVSQKQKWMEHDAIEILLYICKYVFQINVKIFTIQNYQYFYKLILKCYLLQTIYIITLYQYTFISLTDFATAKQTTLM